MSFHITYLRRAAYTEETQEKVIEDAQIEIGRGTGCAIVLDDLRVSLRHATIEKRGPVYILTDLPDENGTYVNGESVETHQLAEHDTIQIGSCVLRVRLSSLGEPLAIEVEYPEEGLHTGSIAQVAYRARYQLSSGFLTKRRLTIVGVLVIVGITALAFGSKSTKDRTWTFRTFLSSGPMSQAHSVIEHACTQCHSTTWQPVADTTCKTCHDGPQHHPNQAFTPPCVTCHTEHRGRQAALTVIEDRLCTQCHAALQARGVAQSASLRVVGPDGLAMHGFMRGHPEFAVQVGTERVRLSDQTHLRDVAQVQLNHAMHLKPNKRGPEDFEALKCSNCHQVDAQRAYMVPITYKQDCMRCHPLEFDQRFPKRAIPHDTPEVVHAFLDTTFIRYCRDRLLSHTNESGGPGSEPLQQRRPGSPRLPVEETRTIVQCAEEGVREAEAFLFADKKQSGCTLCHVVQPPAADSPLPTIVQTAILQRWLPHSVFNHQAHARAGRSCEDCHSAARTSEKTTDVLLPGIALCQECHARGSEVRSACVTCHVYHDRSEIKRGLLQYMEERFINHGAQWRNPPTAAAPR